jgi:uncharacterized protein (DUF305 family)
MPTETQSKIAAELADQGDISDETLSRLLRWLLIMMAVAVGAAGLAGGFVWAKTRLISPTPLGVADVGFLQDMIDHHEQALTIAQTYLKSNGNGGAAPYASEVVLYQTRDLGVMDKMLTADHLTRGAPDRLAMAWMAMTIHDGMTMPGTGMPVSQMPGMQTQARIDELAAARGPAADRLFFAMMTDHHRGGIDMANEASTTAKRKAVRDFAAYVAGGQQIEINEYAQAVARLKL